MKLRAVLVAVFLFWPLVSRPNSEPSGTAARIYQFDIRAGALSNSFRPLFEQSNFVVSIWADDVDPEDVKANAVKGAFSIDQAMTLMLANTGLAHQLVSDRSLIITRSLASSEAAAPLYRFEWPKQSLSEAISALSAQTSTRVLLDVSDSTARAQVPPLSATLTIGQAADYIVGAQVAPSRRTDCTLHWEWRSKTIRFYCDIIPPTAAGKRIVLGTAANETVIVTGSRIPLSSSSSLPAFSAGQQFGQGFIRAFNIESAGDILDYSPQQPFRRADNSFMGEDYAELRGLGWDTTSILINGHPTFASKVTMNSVDISDIPAILIDHVDVLSDSGSALYGGEAMGGVVNIILKKRFDRPEVEAEYGGADGGARLRRGSLGASFTTDRSTTTVAFETYDREVLLGASRRLWRDQDYRRYGLSDYRSLASSPGTVYSLSGSNLPGLDYSFATIPRTGSDHQISITDFAATQGQRNYESLSRYYTISPSRERNTVFVSTEFRPSDSTTVSGELLLIDSGRAYQYEPESLIRAVVPASNPYNPFGENVAIDYLLSDAGPTQRSVDSELGRAVISAETRIGDATWTSTALGSRGESKSVLLRANIARAMAALRATDPQLALNPFSSSANKDAVITSLLDRFVDTQSSDGQQIASVLQGPVTLLGDNVAHYKVGAEWRRESVHLDTRSGSPQTADGGRSVRSAFAEIELPFSLWPTDSTAGLTLSGRWDDYDDTGVAFNPRIGAVWQPSRDLTVRASYGASTRPASLFDMYTPEIIIPNTPVLDPQHRGQFTAVTYISGGNPDLEPFTSRSFTANALWNPVDLPWQVMATYWNTEIENRISAATIFDLTNHETAFPGRVIRAAPSEEDLAAGRPGRLLLLDGTRINGGLTQTSGIDFQAQYEKKTSFAAFTLGLSASWTDVFNYRSLPGVEPIGVVNKARSVYGTIPRWRVSTTFAMEFSAAQLAIFASYIPAYDDATPLFREPNGRRIGPRTLVDLHMSFDLGTMGNHAMTEGMWLHMGAKNVFNRMPDPADVGALNGYDITQFDLIGRQWSVKLSKRF